MILNCIFFSLKDVIVTIGEIRMDLEDEIEDLY